MLRRQVELNNETAISLGLFREPQISGGQAFKLSAGYWVSFCVGMSEEFKRFRPVIVPNGHYWPPPRLQPRRTQNAKALGSFHN